MITVINTIKLPEPITRAQAREIFLATAPTYQRVDGLVRKYYILSEDGRTAGGIYLWHSRAQADALYTPSWRAFVRARYGSDPSLTYFDSPVVVDNPIGEILSDG